MVDKKEAKVIAKTFTEQELPTIDGIDAFAHFAQAMEFATTDDKTVTLTMSEDDGEYFCEITVGDKAQRCYDYCDSDAIADTICEIV